MGTNSKENVGFWYLDAHDSGDTSLAVVGGDAPKSKVDDILHLHLYLGTESGLHQGRRCKYK